MGKGGQIFVRGGGRPVPPPAPPPNYGVRAVRKIALIGTASSIADAPWTDPSWEIWAHASAKNICGRVDRWFDLHPKSEWAKPKNWDNDYLGWLKHQSTPIYMQEHYDDIPASVAYPRDRITAEFGYYFTSQAAWMIALALAEGVTHLGFFGIHYQDTAEYRTQRAGCEWMMGVAYGRGVNLVVPMGCPLLCTPRWLYGYESHTPERIAERKRRREAARKAGQDDHDLDLPLPPDIRMVRKPGEWDADTDPFSRFRAALQRKLDAERDEQARAEETV